MVCWGACWCLVLWLHVIRCGRWFWMVCECAVCVFVLGVMVGFAVGYLVLRCFVLLCDCASIMVIICDCCGYYGIVWVVGFAFWLGGFAVGLRFCVGCVALLPVTVVLIGLLWIVCVGWWECFVC